MAVHHAETRSCIQTEYICGDVNCIVTYGYSSAGDGGYGVYVRVPAEPTHAGKVQSLDCAWWELRESRPNILQFGGIDDGTITDDTGAFSRLSSYGNTKEVCAWVPPTKNGFATNGPHFFHHGLCGEGNGWGCLVFVTHPTNTVVTSCHQLGAPFRGVHYLASVTRTAGATIWVDAPEGTVCFKPDISDNVFQGGYWDIVLNRATIATIKDNFSTDFGGSFAIVQNVDFPDNGDHTITGNTWDTSKATAGAGITQYNAGGCRISNNKGGRGAFAYELCLTGTLAQSTSVLNFSNNSFENQLHGAIRLRRMPGATATFGKVLIDGNEFSSSVLDNPSIQLDDGQNFVDSIVVNDNIIQFPVIGIAATAAKKFTIGGNTFRSYGGTSIGIACGASSSGVIDNDNVFNNVTTKISNASANVVVN